MNTENTSSYQILTTAAGLVDLANRTRIEITGVDRLEFLHGLCTNDIRKLAPGAGCEAFITTVQGKILDYVRVFTGPDSLVLDTVPGQGDKLYRHFDKYLIRQKVELADRSGEWATWLLAGPLAAAVLHTAGVASGVLPSQANDSVEGLLSGKSVWLRRVDWLAVDGFLLDSLSADHAALGELLTAAGAAIVDYAAYHTARIEHSTPEFGTDIAEQNLPQEVARDARTISFTKGCYLGQETVARIDALGHVNRYLVQLRFTGETVPPPGTKLTADGKEVGVVTSSCYSPRDAAPIALAYVRRNHHISGTRLVGCTVE
jgi:folate-binding protein YgfZ